ncbi:MAG: TetR/AcrR family transcriptional regulator [bacterium]
MARTPLRTRLRKEARNAILDAAEEVFAKEGLHRGRMEHVSRRAGTAVGTLYNHFENREALLATLLQTRRQELLAGVDRAVAEAGDSFSERVAAFVDAILAHYEAHRPFFAILIQGDVAGKARVTPPGAEHTSRQLVARAEEIVRQGVREGKLRRKDSDLWPDLLVGGIRALLVRDLDDGTRRGKLVTAQRYLDFFFHGTGPSRRA